ncbi:MAG: hypothetical protein Q9179_007914 [Wetmoreana sp. 5 TL-2023]
MHGSYGGFDNPFPETLNDPNSPIDLRLYLGPIDFSSFVGFHPSAAGISSLKLENTSTSPQHIEEYTSPLGLEDPWVSAKNIINFENASVSDLEAHYDPNPIVDPGLSDGARGLDIREASGSRLSSQDSEMFPNLEVLMDDRTTSYCIEETCQELQEYQPPYAGNDVSPDSSRTVSLAGGHIWSQNKTDNPDQRFSFSGVTKITTKATARDHPLYSLGPASI